MKQSQFAFLALVCLGIFVMSLIGAIAVFGAAEQTASVALLVFETPVVPPDAGPGPTAWAVPTLPPAWTPTPAVELVAAQPTRVVQQVTPITPQPLPTRKATRAVPKASPTALPVGGSFDSGQQEAQATVIAELSIPNANVAFYNIPGASADAAWELAQDAFPLKTTVDGEVGAVQALWTRTECNANNRLEFEWSLTVYLPAWQAPPDVSAFEIEQGWNAPLRVLARHEAGHVRIFEEGLQAARAGLPGPDCAADTDYLNVQVQTIAQQQEAYDVATDHGVNQP